MEKIIVNNRILDKFNIGPIEVKCYLNMRMWMKSKTQETQKLALDIEENKEWRTHISYQTQNKALAVLKCLLL